MLQNKIYQNFVIEIFKTFFLILFGLTIIALTVRAVSFLDLIVDNGYPVSIYFQYSMLNLFGIAPKFIPLSFLIAIIIFILKHVEDSEFVILWTSGVKKMQIVNLFFFSSLIVFIFYLLLSTFLTPLALNKSRQLLSKDTFNSFVPTVRQKQFSDSFKGFTFIIEKKVGNEIQNIFLHDDGNNLKNFSSNSKDTQSTTVIAENGIINSKKMFLFNGSIISAKKNNIKNEIIKFDQLNINLGDLVTTTIKQPKIQETKTSSLLKCFLPNQLKIGICREEAKKEVVPNLIRRIILPLYVPIISLICSFLLLKRNKIYLNNISIFFYSFLVLIFTELAIRYTGINNQIRLLYIVSPFILIFSLYFFLNYFFLRESK
jgi:lipopolysaccharide export system permease protein